MENYDFLAIGDAVVDDFIKLTDAEAYCDLDQENCKLCVRFGDKVPYDSHELVYAVGNSPNAAVSAARLGAKTALMAVVGNDTYGDKCFESLKANNVATEFVQKDPSLPTNYHYVLWYPPERTILIKHAQYARTLPANLVAPKWIYLSSLGENTEAFQDEIASYLEAHPETKLTYQPGTFQMKLGIEKTKRIYARTELFVCNFEEAQRILGNKEGDVKKQMDALHALGPKHVIVTDGIKGAYAREENGAMWYMPIYPHTPFERTGAGDAFASTLSVALLLGKTIEEALMWGPINSMSVVQQVGAQKGLLTQAQIAEYLAKAPAEYKPRKI